MLLFILSWAIKQLIFAYWLYLLIKHWGFFWGGGGGFVANSGYFTVFTPHIYFIILTSMIAGNLIEIRLPKIQSRKPKEFFPFAMFEMFSSVSLSYL